jgi:hypothetical protein
MDVDVSSAVILGIAALFTLVAVWRGATVSTAVRPDGVRVRNRWRQVTVPFSEIVGVEIRSSLAYGFVGVLLSLWLTFRPDYSAIDADALDRAGGTDMVMLRRSGHRRMLPVAATMGMARHFDEMQPYFDALAAHGHEVTFVE